MKGEGLGKNFAKIKREKNTSNVFQIIAITDEVFGREKILKGNRNPSKCDF